MVTQFRFSAGGEDRFRKLLRLLQAVRQFNTADRTVFLITCPTAACNIASYDTFQGKHRKLTAFHALSLKFFCTEKFGHIVRID